MVENVQRFRGHMQRVVSLLNLHIEYQESAKIPDFVKKLRMRIELMADASPLTFDVAEQKATMSDTLKAIENIVSRAYDPEKRNVVDYHIGDLQINQSALATLSQIFAEFLSNIYSRVTPENTCQVGVKIFADAAGRITLSVQDASSPPDAATGPLDLLTSRVISELTRSLDGEARFDGEDIFNARLTFPIPPPAP